jgi:Spy/CpxP family protein refolding chaperone
MRKHLRYIAIVLTALVFASAGAPALAQQRQMQGPPDEADVDSGQGRGGPPSQEKREELRKRIEAIRIWRLTEALKLDEKTSAKFFPVLSSLTQRRHELLRENMETERELRLFLEVGKPDEKKIKAALDKMEKNHHEMMKLTEKEIEATKDYLTVEQQARYYLFQQDFQREMRRKMAGARGAGQGPGRQGMRGGSGRPDGSMDSEP